MGIYGYPRFRFEKSRVVEFIVSKSVVIMPFNHFFVFTGRDYKAACEFLKQHYFDFEQGSSQDNPKDSENLHSPDCPKIQSRSSIGDYKMNRMERIFKGLNIMLEPARQVCCIRSTVK